MLVSLYAHPYQGCDFCFSAGVLPELLPNGDTLKRFCRGTSTAFYQDGGPYRGHFVGLRTDTGINAPRALDKTLSAMGSRGRVAVASLHHSRFGTLPIVTRSLERITRFARVPYGLEDRCAAVKHQTRFENWSERQDLNLRPHGSRPRMLPGYTTL